MFEMIAESCATLIVLLTVFATMAIRDWKQRRVSPSAGTPALLEDLPKLSLLAGTGAYHVSILRQSGYVHAEYEVPGPLAALSQAMATFRRARIDSIFITHNSAGELHFSRLMYNHRGRAEGKKVGSVRISCLS